jgi:hypothetical protein
MCVNLKDKLFWGIEQREEQARETLIGTYIIQSRKFQLCSQTLLTTTLPSVVAKEAGLFLGLKSLYP